MPEQPSAETEMTVAVGTLKMTLSRTSRRVLTMTPVPNTTKTPSPHWV
jgi:hypothetical protein